MGALEFFRGRRRRESAVAPEQLEAAQEPSEVEPIGRMFPAKPETGKDEAGADQGEQLDLGQIVGMFGQAIKSGNAQVALGSADALNAQGEEMSEQIRALLRRHGVSERPDGGELFDAEDPEGLQRQIMEVLARNGLDLPGDR